MATKDLHLYEAQLEQVNIELNKNSNNEDLKKLKNDLEDLIKLTKTLMTTNPSTNNNKGGGSKKSTTIKSKKYKEGDKVQAKWSRDGNYYNGIIMGISEIEKVTFVSVKFEGYESIELAKVEELKPYIESKSEIQQKQQNNNLKKKKKKRKVIDSKKLEELELENKKLELMHNKKQKNWKNFLNKKIPQYNNNKNINSNESSFSKIGLVNSGKPMTQYEKRRKHVFNVEEEE